MFSFLSVFSFLIVTAYGAATPVSVRCTAIVADSHKLVSPLPSRHTKEFFHAPARLTRDGNFFALPDGDSVLVYPTRELSSPKRLNGAALNNTFESTTGFSGNGSLVFSAVDITPNDWSLGVARFTLWERSTGRKFWQLPFNWENEDDRRIAISYDGRYFAAVGGGSVYVFDVFGKPEPIAEFDHSRLFRKATAVFFAEDNRRIFVSPEAIYQKAEGLILKFEDQSLTFAGSIPALDAPTHEDTPNIFDGKLLGIEDLLKLTRAIHGGRRRIADAHFFGGNRYLAILSDTNAKGAHRNNLMLFDLSNRTSKNIVYGAATRFENMFVEPQGRFAVLGGTNSIVVDLSNGETVYELQGGEHNFATLGVDVPQRIVTGSFLDGKVREWKIPQWPGVN